MDIKYFYWKVVERKGELVGVDNENGDEIIRDLAADECEVVVKQHNELVDAFVATVEN